MEIRDEHKCIRGASSLPCNSVGPAPKGAKMTTHYCSERLKRVVLHVNQKFIQGLEVMEIEPAHTGRLSGWKFLNRPSLRRK